MKSQHYGVEGKFGQAISALALPLSVFMMADIVSLYYNEVMVEMEGQLYTLQGHISAMVSRFVCMQNYIHAHPRHPDCEVINIVTILLTVMLLVFMIMVQSLVSLLFTSCRYCYWCCW